MIHLKRVAVALFGLVLVAGSAQAQSGAQAPSTLLEKGIYYEQTAGDLDAAMRIYKQIAEDDQANRPLAAQAQYRLGLCQLKKKQSDAAADSFRKVVSLYPDQQDLVAQAQRNLEQLGAAANGEKGAAPPKPARPGVIRTNPPALADDVDPSLDKITVTFNYPMTDRSWSWTGSGPMLPKSTGSPSYDAARRVCTLPVKLEPGKVYQIGVNSKDFKNFRTAAGTPVPWYMIVFATRSADGKPTPIPQNLQQQARAINQISDAQVGTVQQGPPKVIRSVPKALADNVSASMDKITVTFDQAMLDGNWSWTGSGETYPETPGKSSYDAAKRTCTLPVKLEPGKVYWVGVNSPDFQNFRAADGTPAARYVILFATESADGKPTPIPQDLLDQAREINGAPVVTGQPSAGEAPASPADPDRQEAIEQVFADPEPIVAIANKIFEGIRKADYDRWINGEAWGSFPITQYYQTYQWYDVLVPWICKTFKADPIKDVSLGKVVKNEDGLPAIPYKLTLASGKVMDGVLPFNYADGRWYARWGLDWHLGNRMRLTEARKTTPPPGPAKVEMRVIGKPVSAFTVGDLSTPESAAANYCRASGNMDAEALAAVSLAPVDAADMQRAFERNKADMEIYNKAQATATILQVLTYRDGVAKVVVKLNFPPGVGRLPFSGRTFGLFNGKWKNMGEDRYPGPQAVRTAFEKAKDAIWDDYMQTVEGQGAGGGGTSGAALQPADLKDIQRRSVDKAVSDFADKMDLSTPEAACASWMRAWARQDAKAVHEASGPTGSSVRDTEKHFRMMRVKDREATSKDFLAARIIEVLTCRNDMADVIVKVPRGNGGSYYSCRGFGNLGGQWKNMGEDTASSVEEAERTFAAKKENLWKYYQGFKVAESKQREAEQHPALIEAEARQFFEVIRTTDYGHWAEGHTWERFPLRNRYETYTDWPSLVAWMDKTFSQNPITDVQIGKGFRNDDGLMAVHYKLTLKDGALLEGDLPFYWEIDHWHGKQGIDWHLKYKNKPLVKGAGGAGNAPASQAADLSSPEATIRGFMQAAVAGDADRAMAYVLPGSHDYEDIREILTNTAAPGNPFPEMFSAIDPKAPVEITKVERQGDRAEIAWRFKFGKPWTIQEGGKPRTFKPGETFDLDGNLKKVGDAWLINGI